MANKLFNFVRFALYILYLKTFKFSRFKGVDWKLILAQSAHETGYWTSSIFKTNKNLFGMKLAHKRETVATGEASGHATYRTYYDSVLDYFLRQEAFKSIDVSSPEKYISTTVASGYAEDKIYQKSWTTMYSNITEMWNANKTKIIGFISLTALCIWLLLKKSGRRSQTIKS